MISDLTTTLRRRLPRALSQAGALLLVLVLGVFLVACGDETGGMGLEPPSVVGSIENQSLLADDAPAEFNVGDVFEGEELSYSASSSNSEVVAASVSGTTLTVDPKTGGSATVTVTAENDAGTAEVSFDVNIDLPDGPDPPES